MKDGRAGLLTILGLLALAAVLALVAVVVRRPRPEELGPQKLEPVVTGEPLANSTPLPDGTVVLDAKDAKKVEPPFVLRDDVTAARGLALAVPEARGSADKTGRAEFSLAVPRAGRYHAWARVRWRDECGNSISLAVAESPKRLVSDGVFDAWHWVNAGTYALDGTCRVAVFEREDGVAIDQLLFTPDPKFEPVGAALPTGMAAGVRRFGDNFARSPGHGIGPWDLASGTWKIQFSFDPNRIPNQYSLTGKATGQAAAALIKGRPWKGVRIAFSVRPAKGAEFGVTFRSRQPEQRADVTFGQHPHGTQYVRTRERHVDGFTRIDPAFRPGQWHRVVIERWGEFIGASVDGELVYAGVEHPLFVGRVGLLVAEGSAVFDDVDVTELPWIAEDGRENRIAWQVAADARWFRSPRPDQPGALIGRRGRIAAPPAGLPARHVIVIEAADHSGRWRIPGFAPLPGTTWPTGVSQRHLAPQGAAGGAAVQIEALEGRTSLKRVAICYGPAHEPDVFRLGPYDFAEPRIVDPSDYYDFTPEEIARMRRSPNADTLRRRKKYLPLVGSGGSSCVWARESGAWRVIDGELIGAGPDAALRYSQEIIGDLEARLKVKLSKAGPAAVVVLYGDAESGVRVRLGGDPPAGQARVGCLHLPVPPDERWHTVRIRAEEDMLEAAVDRQPPKRARAARGDGGSFVLKVPAGAVRFDDIEFAVPRRQPRGTYSTFDRRETGWWREGGRWIDHGGMTCVLASHWVSLAAPGGDGMLWHKRRFGPDVQVAFNIEESSEWFGWTKDPSHVHHPYDNIRVVLAPEEGSGRGYRLEVNSRNRTATVLYRNGKEVASVRQDETFPIQYVGGHAPYRPRKNRIALVKRGDVLRAIVNGREVLRFTDPDAVPVARVGVGGYRTHVNFSHIEIRDLSPKRAGFSGAGQ